MRQVGAGAFIYSAGPQQRALLVCMGLPALFQLTFRPCNALHLRSAELWAGVSLSRAHESWHSRACHEEYSYHHQSGGTKLTK